VQGVGDAEPSGQKSPIGQLVLEGVPVVDSAAQYHPAAHGTGAVVPVAGQ
jgi:hypothetical protein